MPSDVFLVKKAKKGDKEAFVQLFKIYENVLYNTARRFLNNQEDIADCLQDTALTAYKNIENLQKPEYFNSWIYRILINNCKKILKMRKQENFWIEYGEEKEGMVESIELRQMLQNLDIKYRIPLILYYYNGFSIKEISSILSEPVNTVKTHLARGKKLLRIEDVKEGKNGYL
ncbi:RNA polymerase subunit sigma [Enterococcus villorum]|uniref:RNA polymerase subunit sigma n=1 Tax=Enterococcus villorum TaxID=112904 RepID=A0A1V8YKQ1_9ENTE|nr:sigma-70 family RNA polymerase sigma factor [Enterococcus villorum]OQO68277.1 RNA polymerase subunit sigma [Enterococcus villorum]OQO73191.1 RNA polymerase subunit sigma [Enterococcus villorum]